MAFLPRFGPDGSLIYFCCVAAGLFTLSMLVTAAGLTFTFVEAS